MSVAEADFICNLNSCRRQLVNAGWVTSCSHMFCEEDGQGKLRQDGQSKCPVCDTLLPNKYDVVHVNLNPSEEYKSMVLAGMRPEVAMDIAGRAVAFWAYQMSSERSYHERAARKAVTHIEHITTTNEAAVAALKAELSAAHRKMAAQDKEVESLHCKLQEQRDTLAERGRQLQKAQAALSMVRRSTMNKSCESPNSLGSDGISPSKASSVGSSLVDVFSMEQSEHSGSITPKKSHNDAGLPFRPVVNFPNNGGRCNLGLQYAITKK